MQFNPVLCSLAELWSIPHIYSSTHVLKHFQERRNACFPRKTLKHTWHRMSGIHFGIHWIRRAPAPLTDPENGHLVVR